MRAIILVLCAVIILLTVNVCQQEYIIDRQQSQIEDYNLLYTKLWDDINQNHPPPIRNTFKNYRIVVWGTNDNVNFMITDTLNAKHNEFFIVKK